MGGSGEAWMWRSMLFAWEEKSVRGCCSFLHNIVLQAYVLDNWKWLLDHIKGYSVSWVYHLLTAAENPTDKGLVDNVWHKQVPLKVSLFAWCLLCNTTN